MSDNNPKSGTFCWHELVTKDAEACKKFYGALFGWTFTEKEIRNTPHTIFHKDGQDLASMFQILPEWGDLSPHWMTYIAVDDVDAKAREAEELGGSIVVPPTDIPTVGRASVVLDPGGAAVAFIKMNS